MQQIKRNLGEHIRGKKSVFLFTGDNGSALLMGVVKNMNVNIVFIDTGYHFNEIIDYVKSYGSEIVIIKNNSASAEPAGGMDKCCYQRKIEVLKGYLDNLKAECLIVSFRDEEKDNKIEDSYLRGIDNIKIIMPLSDLTERDIWIKIKENKLTFSKIYNKGYKFVDCKCCTTRHGRRNKDRGEKIKEVDRETEEKLKSLGYM